MSGILGLPFPRCNVKAQVFLKAVVVMVAVLPVIHIDVVLTFPMSGDFMAVTSHAIHCAPNRD